MTMISTLLTHISNSANAIATGGALPGMATEIVVTIVAGITLVATHYFFAQAHENAQARLDDAYDADMAEILAERQELKTNAERHLEQLEACEIEAQALIAERQRLLEERHLLLSTQPSAPCSEPYTGPALFLSTGVTPLPSSTGSSILTSLPIQPQTPSSEMVPTGTQGVPSPSILSPSLPVRPRAEHKANKRSVMIQELNALSQAIEENQTTYELAATSYRERYPETAFKM